MDFLLNKVKRNHSNLLKIKQRIIFAFPVLLHFSLDELTKVIFFSLTQSAFARNNEFSLHACEFDWSILLAQKSIISLFCSSDNKV